MDYLKKKKSFRTDVRVHIPFGKKKAVYMLYLLLLVPLLMEVGHYLINLLSVATGHSGGRCSSVPQLLPQVLQTTTSYASSAMNLALQYQLQGFIDVQRIAAFAV